MNFKNELNFLKFLTISLSNSLYDNETLTPLFKKIDFSHLKRSINSFVEKLETIDYYHEINLYIHIPYCLENCNYCYCPHCQLSTKEELVEYENFLLKQMSEFSPLFSGIDMNSIYFGGGTPSLLNKKSIQRIFESLFKHFSFRSKIQINFEAHPSSLSLDKLKVLKEYGVNRLSLGVQSLDENVLKRIGRMQDNRTVYKCIENIKRLKFPYLNIDLMVGLPGQGTKSFISDLKKIIQLKPEIIHINPFSDVVLSLYCQTKKMDMHKFIKKRHTMILEAKRILKNSSYKRCNFEAYQLKKGGESYQELSYFEHAGSVLGLGINAKSNLAGEIVFENLPAKDRFVSSYFLGRLINKRYTMANFIIWHLLKGFRNESFRKLFNEDPLKVFKEELFFLENIGLIKKKKGALRYVREWTMKGLFDYFSYTKIFYGKDILSELKKVYRDRYNPRKNYNFNKYFIKLFQDYLVTVMYYDIGF